MSEVVILFENAWDEGDEVVAVFAHEDAAKASAEESWKKKGRRDPLRWNNNLGHMEYWDDGARFNMAHGFWRFTGYKIETYGVLQDA